MDKARSWLHRCVTLDPDIGDHWALLYCLECEHGTTASQESVMERCRSAQPRHGERWTQISKAQENAHQSTDALLKKVVAHLASIPIP